MSSITIRNVDEGVKRKIKIIAAQNGRSMEAELHEILKRATSAEVADKNPLLAFRKRFEAIGGVELEIPPRGATRPLPDFGK